MAQHYGLTLAELGKAVENMAYPAVGLAVCRMEIRIQTDRKLKKTIDHIENKLLNVST